jgi:hypothetical protein
MSLRDDDADRFELELDRAEQADPIFLDRERPETAAQRRYREWYEYDGKEYPKDPSWCYLCDRPCDDCACDRDERDECD